jgi:hypothetical protein
MKKIFFLLIVLLIVFTKQEVQNVEEVKSLKQSACTYTPISKLTTFILAIVPFTASLGIDRFFDLSIGIGVLKLLINLCCNLCCCGIPGIIFWLIDFISLLTGTRNTDGLGCPYARDFI